MIQREDALSKVGGESALRPLPGQGKPGAQSLYLGETRWMHIPSIDLVLASSCDLDGSTWLADWFSLSLSLSLSLVSLSTCRICC
jgi:hypothetical protein